MLGGLVAPKGMQTTVLSKCVQILKGWKFFRWWTALLVYLHDVVTHPIPRVADVSTSTSVECGHRRSN